jgi:hypothetical protein
MTCRMRRFLLLPAFLAQLALAQAGFAQTPACKGDARLIGQCFVVHGRLSVHANMRPYLWPVGTRRLLGIASPDGAIIMPAELQSLFAAHLDRQAFGDFEVCPFTRQRPGVMQMVCIAAVTHLAVREAR